MKTMLKIINIFILIFLSINIYSQNTGNNNLNHNFDKYVGTWKWEGNGKSFTIIFKKIYGQYPINVNISGDMLIGYHEYKNNGVIVESSLSNKDSSLDQKLYSISGGYTPTANKLEIGVSHISKRKSVEAKIEYVDPTHIKIVSFSNYQGIKINTPTYTYDPAISFPDNIILTKQ
ncbi:DUF6705 family protein [Chryseobacterium zhengzhouense]|uniref:DUF6705 family protein n=1 Tax=Chryseobacterium zhengzhouense TaxID=1636086 RepID=A0ABW2M3M6_9FLAO